MGFQAILGLQFRGWKAAVICTAGTALHSSPVSVAVLRRGLAQLGQGSRGQGRVLQQPHGAPVSTLSLISQQAGLVA